MVLTLIILKDRGLCLVAHMCLGVLALVLQGTLQGIVTEKDDVEVKLRKNSNGIHDTKPGLHGPLQFRNPTKPVPYPLCKTSIVLKTAQ